MRESISPFQYLKKKILSDFNKPFYSHLITIRFILEEQCLLYALIIS